MSLPIRSSAYFGSLTATLGTVITRLIPPRGAGTKKLRTILTGLSYTSAGTAHTISLIRPFANTPVVAAAASGQKVVTLTVDPGAFPKGPVAGVTQVAAAPTTAGDYLVFETTSGTYYYDKVASVAGGAVAGQLAATLTANLPTLGLAAGATAWLMKAPGGTDVYTGLANEVLMPPISATYDWRDIENGIFGSVAPYEPILIQSNNITAAGVLLGVSVVYANLG